LKTSAEYAERIRELRERSAFLASEEKRVGVAAGIKVLPTPPAEIREIAGRIIQGERGITPATFADPAVYLCKVKAEQAAIRFALETLENASHRVMVQEENARYIEREPGRNKITARVSGLVRELMLVSLELRAYDVETGGTAVQTAPGGRWPELATGHIECFLPRWLRMAVKQGWIRRSDVASAFKAADLSTFDLG
jgi:hypothetical protein